MIKSFFQLFLSPESLEGGENEGENNTSSGSPPEKMFTQAEVDRFVTTRQKKVEREKKELEKSVATLTETVTQLQASLDALQKKTPETTPPPDDLQGQLNLINERHRRETDGLRAEIDKLVAENTRETKRRKETERDKEIDSALIAAECKDMIGGRRFVLPQVSFDDLEDKWIFELSAGGTVSIREGVAEDLPDYLRRPSSERGGSGSNNGDRIKSRRAATFEAEEKKLQTLRAKSEASGGKGPDLHAYMKQKQLVEGLRKELSVR